MTNNALVSAGLVGTYLKPVKFHTHNVSSHMMDAKLKDSTMNYMTGGPIEKSATSLLLATMSTWDKAIRLGTGDQKTTKCQKKVVSENAKKHRAVVFSPTLAKKTLETLEDIAFFLRMELKETRKGITTNGPPTVCLIKKCHLGIPNWVKAIVTTKWILNGPLI
jgi:hypothetical protein